ncbi:MAG: hypothetical protein K6C33_05700 [Desulfovibrio sp.]|nr:hypothetical protein [Desulfovibrio sp.]
MLLQVTAGQGPAECRIAVRLLCESLCREFAGTAVLDVHADYASALLEGPEGLAALCGTVGWVCRSPLRPSHKRKNWFIHVAAVPELKEITQDSEVRVSTFRSGGPGGQNVNKVETAVRVVHVATGITVVCSDERSQKQNRVRAMARLRVKLWSRPPRSAAARRTLSGRSTRSSCGAIPSGCMPAWTSCVNVRRNARQILGMRVPAAHPQAVRPARARRRAEPSLGVAA